MQHFIYYPAARARSDTACGLTYYVNLSCHIALYDLGGCFFYAYARPTRRRICSFNEHDVASGYNGYRGIPLRF